MANKRNRKGSSIGVAKRRAETMTAGGAGAEG